MNTLTTVKLAEKKLRDHILACSRWSQDGAQNLGFVIKIGVSSREIKGSRLLKSGTRVGDGHILCIGGRYWERAFKTFMRSVQPHTTVRTLRKWNLKEKGAYRF